MNRLKSCYKIRLYRSRLFYLLCAVFLALACFHFVYNFCLLIRVGFNDLFFPQKQSVYAASETQPTDNMPFITGVLS